jgi:hypothetical protein
MEMDLNIPGWFLTISAIFFTVGGYFLRRMWQAAEKQHLDIQRIDQTDEQMGKDIASLKATVESTQANLNKRLDATDTKIDHVREFLGSKFEALLGDLQYIKGNLDAKGSTSKSGRQ